VLLPEYYADPTDEIATIGVDLSEKLAVEHDEGLDGGVNAELIGEEGKEELATVEPVPGRLVTQI
jgi:hypothetical protein